MGRCIAGCSGRFYAGAGWRRPRWPRPPDRWVSATPDGSGGTPSRRATTLSATRSSAGARGYAVGRDQGTALRTDDGGTIVDRPRASGTRDTARRWSRWPGPEHGAHRRRVHRSAGPTMPAPRSAGCPFTAQRRRSAPRPLAAVSFSFTSTAVGHVLLRGRHGPADQRRRAARSASAPAVPARQRRADDRLLCHGRGRHGRRPGAHLPGRSTAATRGPRSPRPAGTWATVRFIDRRHRSRRGRQRAPS